MGTVETTARHLRKRLGPIVSAGWQSAAADAQDAKADSLDLTIERLEGDHAFLAHDFGHKAQQIRITLGLIRMWRNDYRDDAKTLRGGP